MRTSIDLRQEAAPLGAGLRVDDVLITPELARRPSRAPDHAAENRALGALAREMAASPGTVLQKLTDLVVEAGWAQSAGVSILEPRDPSTFRWHAVSGLWAGHVGGTMSFDASPCGVVVTRDAPLLFARPHERFPAADIEPLIRETLLVPFHVAGRPAGTLWAIAHDDGWRFDAEDLRVLTGLARFASAAHQMNGALAEAEDGREEMERRVEERTGELARTNERLRGSEERFRVIVENARDYAIFTTDTQYRIADWLPGAAAVFGWTAGEVAGRPAALLFTPEDRAGGEPEKEAETARAEGMAPDVRWHLRKDGSRVFIEGKVAALRDPDGSLRGFVKIGQDVTGRRTAEEALRESERRFRALAEGVPNFVFRSRGTGERLWGSPQWVDYAGLSLEDSVGLGWLRAVHPEDRPATMAAWAEAEARGIFSVEHRTRRAADGAWRWFQSRAAPVRDGPDAEHPGGGRIVEWLGTSTDIEDLVRAREVLARGREEMEALVAARTAELAAAEETLRQAQKMEAVGQLTGGIAHDFNNMLQGVSGALELARRRIADGRAGEAGRYLDAAREAAGRAAGLTRRLLAFARRQRLDPRPVDPDGLVEGMADLVRRTVGPGVRVELKLRDGAGIVLCDAGELESALLNLCINARDAMPEGGRLTVCTEDLRLSAADVAGREGGAPGDYVAVCVADTGQGMPPEILERVFEPFFTTKPVGQGTGLGLSQVYGFARQSGGLVRLESAPGRGTTVRLFLPRHERAAAEAEERAAPPAAPAREGVAGATVLLVDDEAAVRGPAAERLRELGHRVLEAADGPAALRLLGEGVRIDLLVTDVGLPNGMNGRQVAEAVRERLPGVPVLFITGYAGGGRLPPGSEVIDKPFGLDALARRVQALLAARRDERAEGAGPRASG